MDLLSPLYAMESAHRVPTRLLPPGAPLYPILVRILHFQDRDTILWIAWDLSDLKFDNHKISTFPDFSAEVQRGHMQFLDINEKHCDLQDYSRLHVTALDKTHIFE